MSTVILFRDDVDWKYEADAAKKYFYCTNSRMNIKSGDLVIPRFSALPFYKEQENDINSVGARLINTYDQHMYIADLGNWYQDLRDFTPKTWRNVSDIPNYGPFVLKGETNSKKFYWKELMFAENKKEAIEIQGKLLRDSLLQYQNIYVRQYIPLEKLNDGLQGLPISREYRFFIYKNTILSGGFYWSSDVENLKEKGVKIDSNEVPREFLESVISKIQNTELCIDPPNFYVIDVAKTQDGNWIVIELNDGSMSGLSENDPEILYRKLSELL